MRRAQPASQSPRPIDLHERRMPEKSVPIASHVGDGRAGVRLIMRRYALMLRENATANMLAYDGGAHLLQQLYVDNAVRHRMPNTTGYAAEALLAAICAVRDNRELLRRACRSAASDS